MLQSKDVLETIMLISLPHLHVEGTWLELYIRGIMGSLPIMTIDKIWSSTMHICLVASDENIASLAFIEGKVRSHSQDVVLKVHL